MNAHFAGSAPWRKNQRKQRFHSRTDASYDKQFCITCSYMSGSDYWQMVVLFVLLHVLCYDLWFYGVHRLLHLPYFYTRFHWQHHAHRHPTWQHTFDAHWLENGASGLGLFLPCALFGLDPVALALAWLACLCRGVSTCSKIIIRTHAGSNQRVLPCETPAHAAENLAALCA